MSKPRRLRITRLDEFSLVDSPANPLATIVMTKRATEEKPVSDQNEITEEQAVGWLTKALAALGFRHDDNAVGEETPAAQEETTEKNMADDKGAEEQVAKIEALEKRLEEFAKRAETAEANAQAQAEKVEKLETEKRNAVYVQKAAELKSLPIKADEFGPIMAKMAGALTEDEYNAIEKALAAANEVARVGKLTEEIGKAGPSEGSAEAEVVAKVAELRKADPKLTDQAARGRVYMEHPELRRKVDVEAAQAPVGR